VGAKWCREEPTAELDETTRWEKSVENSNAPYARYIKELLRPSVDDVVDFEQLTNDQLGYIQDNIAGFDDIDEEPQDDEPMEHANLDDDDEANKENDEPDDTLAPAQSCTCSAQPVDCGQKIIDVIRKAVTSGKRVSLSVTIN